MEPEDLRRAADLMRAGQYDQAGLLIARYLQSNPDSADGWTLMSYVVTDTARKRDCLHRALRLDPEHAKARERLADLPVEVAPERTGPEPERSPTGSLLDASDTTSARAQPSEPAAREIPESPYPEWPKPGTLTPPFVEAPEVLELADQLGEQFVPEALASAAEQPGAAEAVRPDPSRSSRRIWTILALVFGFAVVAGGAGLAYSLLGGQLPIGRPAQVVQPTEIDSASPVIATQAQLPASWTPTVTPTITPTQTSAPTSTVTPTPSLIPPNASQQAGMLAIQTEVADLRGLPVTGEVSSYLVSRLKARALLEGMYRAYGGSEAQIEDRKRELVALGLVKPTYDMLDNILNSMADGLGGFYDPADKRLFLIAGGFGGVEQFVYAHEYGHALVDQHYRFDQLGAYPVCQLDQDRCKAISGLVEGDATLLMNQWLEQFAGPQDLLDILAYTPPNFALPEQFPPPFAVMDSQFPYSYGFAFVEFLHGRGNWAAVNAAYADPPQSTEQILHPQKYLAREAPLTVAAPRLEAALGDGWRLLASDSLGEWGTYLLLGYGADVSSQLQDGKALYAAQGWGGDRYQVYYSEATDETVLAAQWVADTESEGEELHRVFQEYLENRFRGGAADLGSGDCYQANAQLSCVYRVGAKVLWLLVPDRSMIEPLLGAYDGFP